MKKIILSAAFLAIGTIAMAQKDMQKMNKKDPAQMEQKRAEKLKMMQSELNLSDAQVSQIRELQDKKMAERKANAPEMQAKRKAKMEMMKTKRDERNAEMKAILTPEQYQKWEVKKQEKMNHRKGKMQERKMTRMPAKS